MPETKMTKMKWGLVALLMVVIGVAAISRGVISNKQQDHTAHHQSGQKKKEPPAPLIDGSKNPNGIPEMVAYELLLNSIANSTGTTEPDKIRAKHLSDKVGLDEKKNKIMTDTANGFRAKIASLDAQAKELKDQNWPYPSSAVMAQLGNLQAQKNKLLREQVDSMLGQLNDSDKEKMGNRLLEIKRKVKMYPATPAQKK
jgi:hypothetical protein